jgi:hypothetical protein
MPEFLIYALLLRRADGLSWFHPVSNGLRSG